MDGFANNGLLPEQIWDTDDIPEKKLFLGKYTGSAMPLTWAHSEYIKLCSSIREKRIFDMSKQTESRYIKNESPSPFKIWRFDWQCIVISLKKILRIEILAPAKIRWSSDNWKTYTDTETIDTGLGLHLADIELINKSSEKIQFTFYWKEVNCWENKDFEVKIEKQHLPNLQN